MVMRIQWQILFRAAILHIMVFGIEERPVTCALSLVLTSSDLHGDENTKKNEDLWSWREAWVGIERCLGMSQPLVFFVAKSKSELVNPHNTHPRHVSKWKRTSVTVSSATTGSNIREATVSSRMNCSTYPLY